MQADWEDYIVARRVWSGWLGIQTDWEDYMGLAYKDAELALTERSKLLLTNASNPRKW